MHGCQDGKDTVINKKHEGILLVRGVLSFCVRSNAYMKGKQGKREREG